jgi:hypothetical protein
MRWRTLKITFLLFQALWLNVIVPGHRRGQIALPGESCAACEEAEESSADCCPMEDQSRRPDSPRPKGDPAKHCLICYFAARVTPPLVIDLTPPPLRFAHLIPVPAAETRTSIIASATYDGRAPPAVS